MKVLFVFPNEYLSIGIPQGIAILSACLKRAGHSTDIFDFTFVKQREVTFKETSNFLPTEYTLEDLVKNDPIEDIDVAFNKKVQEFVPDLIAVSVMSSSFDMASSLLRKNQACISGIPVVFGGVHPTIDVEDVLSHDIVDYAIVGEGEEALVELADKLQQGLSVYDIKNLAYKDMSGVVHINELRPFVDLDSLPCPDWSIFDRRHLFRPFMGKVYNGSFYGMSRGCPYQCNYCVNSTLKKIQKDCGRYFRYQSVEKTFKDLKQLKDRFEVNWIKLLDDSIMSFPIGYIEELHDKLTELDMKFGCSVRPETTTVEKVMLLKKMGCVAMSVGIESGNEEIRKVQLGRRMSNEQIKSAIKIIKEAGIRISTFNMVGLPGETRENVFETINLNRELNVSACNCYVIFPYPGTPIAISSGKDYRDMNGEFIPVEKASSFLLSKMSADEVEGLHKTFNLYLHLPQNMWDIVQAAEGNSIRANNLFDALNVLVDNYFLFQE